MANKRNWNFRGGKYPDEKQLVFKNVTTKEIEKFIKNRISVASNGKLGPKELEELRVISVDIGKRFIPFMVKIPVSLQIKRKQNQNGQQMEPWFNPEQDDKNSCLLDPSVFLVLNAYLYSKKEVSYITDIKGRKEALILKGQDAQLFKLYSKPRKVPGTNFIMAFLDPALVFGDFLVDLDNPNQKFVPYVDMSRSKKISKAEWNFTIIREVLKNGNNMSAEEAIEIMRNRRDDDRDDDNARNGRNGNRK